MKISGELLALTKDNILTFITPDDIYKYYIGKNLIYNKAFCSPFRVDKNPSFLVSSRNFTYKDFATGESGDCFKFVKKLYNVDFNGALKQIAHDLNIASNFNIFGYTSSNRKSLNLKMPKASTTRKQAFTDIQIKRRSFEEHDLDFWNCHGVSLKYLKVGQVNPISHFSINGTHYTAEKYAYAYLEKKDGKLTIKIYQPFSKSMKWINNNNYSVWELWNLLPTTHDKLIITSSRKDALSIIENVKVPSTALQSETMFPKTKIVEELQSRFKDIYLFLDNDYNKKENHGQNHAKKLVERHGFKNIYIPDKYESKDFSDLVCNYDRVTATQIIKQLI